MTDISLFPFTVTEHVVDAQHIREYPNATRRRDASLKLVLKQYTPIDNPNPQPGDITIIGAHGCGFPKVFSLKLCLLCSYFRLPKETMKLTFALGVI